MMRKGGTSSAPTTPRGTHGRGSTIPTLLAEEHHIVATTFVQADVNTFRELVQKLTGGPPPLVHSPGLDPASGKEICPVIPMVRRESGSCGAEPEKTISAKPVGGPGPQRTSTAKLLERRQNARKLEVKQLMGPHILKRAVSPALSPVSPLSTIDVFSENSGATSPLGYMGCTPVARPFFDLEQQQSSRSPGFDLNTGIVHLELERRTVSPREPRLLPLFPVHSPRSLSS